MRTDQQMHITVQEDEPPPTSVVTGKMRTVRPTTTETFFTKNDQVWYKCEKVKQDIRMICSEKEKEIRCSETGLLPRTETTSWYVLHIAMTASDPFLGQLRGSCQKTDGTL